MILLENKIKRAALMTAIEISIRRKIKSPERCARNLMELYGHTYPDKLPKEEYNNFYNNLLALCKSHDSQGIKNLFSKVF